MIVASQSTATAVPGPRQRPQRARRWSAAERAALVVAALATTGFGAYGVATAAPSTTAYVFIVAAVAGVVVGLRRSPLPAPLATALAALAVAHLAGGLIRVGDGVLYNASLGSEVFQYDHLVHSSAVLVGTLVVWTLFARPDLGRGRPVSTVVWTLAGLGLGAVNETVEYLTTLVNQGSQVGGYVNTGWDLVSNVVGAVVAGLLIAGTARRQERDRHPDPA